ncbi:hypothetical protein ACH3O9_18300 [Leeuwenhoekiella sp. A16]|uniref:hypothetical protein n=1 Tax=unclassified Leeuwenhoekiella TaxID=2615029 RepID=UPI003A7F9A76
MKVLESQFRNQIVAHTSFEFGNLYFFKNCVVSEINEGFIIDKEEALELGQEILKYFDEKIQFYVITNRIHSYSIMPSAQRFISQFNKRILAVHFVTYDPLAMRTARFESIFSSVKIMHFTDIHHAILATKQRLVS